jgi:hypothetical protein
VKTCAYPSVILLAAALCLGCGDEKTKTDKTKTTVAGGHAGHVHWCNVCGFIEENDKCGCDNKNAKKCEKCGFQEGSPACCVKELVALHSNKLKDYHVCQKCGELELSGKCGCDDKDAKTCPKCLKHEGSLYCRQHCGTKKDKEHDPEKAPSPVEAPPPEKAAQGE